MTCPKCKSENIQVQTVNEVKEKRKKRLPVLAVHRLVVGTYGMAVPYSSKADYRNIWQTYKGSK